MRGGRVLGHALWCDFKAEVKVLANLGEMGGFAAAGCPRSLVEVFVALEATCSLGCQEGSILGCLKTLTLAIRWQL